MEYLWVLEPDAEYEAPKNKHDKGYKYLLSTKRVFIQLLRCFLDKSWVDMVVAYYKTEGKGDTGFITEWDTDAIW